MSIKSAAGLAALVLPMLLAVAPGTALCQAAPVSGTIALGIVPSSLTPPPGTNFTVDLSINMTAATADCIGSVPMTLGGYTLGIQYNSTELQYVGVAACPSAPAEFNVSPACASNTTVPATSYVNCSGVNSLSGAATTTPQGTVCVARVTFKNLSASIGSSATLSTLHTGGSRSIATDQILGCGGPVLFPTITDGTITPITPVRLETFSAE